MSFMNLLGRAVAVSSFAALTCCAMPSNVTTATRDASGSYIKAIDFSYQSNPAASFNKLKLCIAENVSNGAVQLSDSSGIDAASGHGCDVQHSQIVPAGGIFKYADASLATLIATGTTFGSPGAIDGTRDIIKYDLKAFTHGKKVGLVFTNITRAQQSTGAATNPGFVPVHATGTEPVQVYAALESIADDIKSCLR